MILNDSITLTDATRITEDGYLVATARVARSGIQQYQAWELGIKDGNPSRTINVYRPPEVVFSDSAMRSYAYRPVTIDHPPVQVTADNWKDYAAGQTGGEVTRDGDTVVVPLVLMDAAGISAWQEGKAELSMGYRSELEFSDGVTPDGHKYEAIQTSMKMNHLAFVDRARGGESLRMVDRQHEEKVMTKTVLVDGLPIETTDAGAQAIARLQADVADARKSMSEAASQHASAIEAKDKELAVKDAEIDKLKAAQLTDAQLDERVAARADLIGKAKTLTDADMAGKSDAEIRLAAVERKLGDGTMAGKSEAYVEARFDALIDAEPDTFRKAVKGVTTIHNDSQAKYEDRLRNAYKQGAK